MIFSPHPRFRRGSAAQTFLLLVLLIAAGFGGYLIWKQFEKDRAEASEVPPPPPVKKNTLADLPDVDPLKEEKREDGKIIVVEGPIDLSKTPMPPPLWNLKDNPDVEVKAKRNPVESASELDRQVWDMIKASKPKKSMLQFPYKIPVLELKRRREIAEIVGEYNKIPPEKVVAHPLAQDFPGGVAEKVKRWRTVYNLTEGQEGGWKSTGFYVGPGELITVELSEYDAKRGIGLRIGSHSDSMTGTKREEWHRFPEVIRNFRLNKTEVVVSNPFGGLVFLTGTDRVTAERPLQIRFTGVVKAPCYFLGKTTPDEWSKIRSETKGVPWGELVGKKMVLMLPGEQMRDCADPKRFADYWDALVDAQDYLTGTTELRKHAERINADADISIGFMHSGYPIGIFVSSAPELTDRDSLKTNNWGIHHEVGHNHQKGDWTFKGYGEVTNNLIGLYSIGKISGLPISKARGGADWKDLAIQAIAFHDKGDPDPFECLAYYVPVVEQFGWEPLRKVFTSYIEDPCSGDDDEKKGEFVYRWSVACGVDLGDYSALFGFPKTHAQKYKLAQLKVPLKPWMPKGYPPSLSKIKRIARQKDPKFSNEDSHAAAVVE